MIDVCKFTYGKHDVLCSVKFQLHFCRGFGVETIEVVGM